MDERLVAARQKILARGITRLVFWRQNGQRYAVDVEDASLADCLAFLG